MATALGIERSTYAYYETGSTKPSGRLIIQLANILNVDYRIFMDAIADKKFDSSPENPSFTTLSDSSASDREKMYTLKSKEQLLIMMYRLLTPEQKQEVDRLFAKLHAENLNKNKEE